MFDSVSLALKSKYAKTIKSDDRLLSWPILTLYFYLNNFLFVLFFKFFLQDPNDISFDQKKFRARKPIRKQEAKESIVERTSSLSIRY